jgi:group I intron endonuclease
MFFIYKITNLINGKMYIGQTTNLKQRWNVHKCITPKTSNNQLYKDIKKYGIDNFKIKKISTSKTQKKAHKKEMHFIKKYNTISPYGYNLSIGGKGANGYKYTKKQKIEHSDRMTKVYNTKEGKALQKQRALLQNKPEVKQKTKNKLKLLRSTPEYRKEKSIEQKRVWANPELRKRHSEIIKKTWTEKRKKELKERMKENHPNAKKVKINGKIYKSISQAAKELKVQPKTITKRITSKIKGYYYA